MSLTRSRCTVSVSQTSVNHDLAGCANPQLRPEHKECLLHAAPYPEMPETFKLKTIYEASIPSLIGRLVDLSTCGTPGEIRFIDCDQLHTHNTLRIYETNVLFPPKDQPYATISYVWRGYPDPAPPSGSPPPTFNAKGAESGEGINAHVLSTVCAAALHERIRLLWLDRLCIMQTHDDDKAWQIQQMHALYARAALSLVLPAGIGRLARLAEETPWIHRAWTLQELLAPERSLVLFAWTRGSGTFHGTHTPIGRITEVVPRTAAVADATDVLQLCVDGKLKFAPRDGGGGDGTQRTSVAVRVFTSSKDAPQLWATLVALRLRGSEAAESAVWRSALMRTSSRPADMVFSIMGLFDVALDPRRFDARDRVTATLALAAAVLEKRRPASWLGASFHLPPSRTLSSFPTFPASSVAGSATVAVHGVTRAVEVIDGEYMSQWWLRKAPRGRIDEDGYLVFRARAAYAKLTDRDKVVGATRATPGVANRSIALRQDGKTYCIVDLEGRTWAVDRRKALTGTTRTMVVLVGVEGRLTSFGMDSYNKFSDRTPVRAIALKNHGEGRWHRVASFFLGDAFKREMEEEWQMFGVAVGGPKPLTEAQREVVRRRVFKGADQVYWSLRCGSSSLTLVMRAVRRKPIEPD
ncbi:hypothetical protein C8Q74DRAFT_1298499 [Fomes fomentarius]|nr:hypothetical protein C8Q74DRAFT_1298499 [Fomes fomentarius]